MKANNLFGELLTKRPGYYDNAVMNEAAEDLAGRIREEFPSDFAHPALVAQLRKALGSCPGADGYELAKHLEREGWEIDARLVEVLDGGCMSEAHDRLVRQWVSENGLQPQHAIGDRVSVRPAVRTDGRIGQLADAVEGEVVGIDKRRATYTVRIESFGHVKEGAGVHGVVMGWEDVDG